MDEIPDQIQWLKHPDEEVRLEAINNIEEFIEAAKIDEKQRVIPQLVTPLIACLQDESSDVREMAAIQLGNLGDASAVEPLTMYLDDKSGNMRESAAEALSKLGTTNSVDVLVRLNSFILQNFNKLVISNRDWIITGAEHTLRILVDLYKENPELLANFNDFMTNIQLIYNDSQKKVGALWARRKSTAKKIITHFWADPFFYDPISNILQERERTVLGLGDQSKK